MMRGGIPFSNPPGVAYEYSNYGFAILGRIVTRVSGVPYKTYVATHVLKPLGMAATTLEPKAVAPLDLRTGIDGKTSNGRKSRSSPTVRSDRWAAC